MLTVAEEKNVYETKNSADLFPTKFSIILFDLKNESVLCRSSYFISKVMLACTTANRANMNAVLPNNPFVTEWDADSGSHAQNKSMAN